MFRSLFSFLIPMFLSVVARADLVSFWNSQALAAFRNDTTPAPLAARDLAVLHVAMHDAVNAVTRTHDHYFMAVTAPSETSVEAAAAAAAHRVLTEFFPSQTAVFDSELANSLNSIPDSAAKTNGVGLGEFVADNILAWRAADGSGTSVPYIPSTEPGAWRRTAPFFRPPELPQWPFVTPFALTNGSQFRPVGPPPLDSAAYAADLNQVKALGRATSTNRTSEQTLIARFWSDFSYTVTPPGHWNQIAQNVVTNHGFTLTQNARLFALLNIALADAGIAVWDAKYAFNFWRPITAIQQADTDGNPTTAADAEWTPLLNTPAFPEYVSGHSTFSAAAATVLGQFLGTDKMPFTVGSDSVPGVLRSYLSFAAAADEIGMSRIYGGIHFLSADLEGLNLGRTIGEMVEKNFLRPLGSPPLLDQSRRNGNAIAFRVSSTAGVSVIIDSSTNLLQWIPIHTNTAPFSFNTHQMDPACFYRARLLR